jgi:hypothetical protein
MQGLVYKMWEPRRLTTLWASTACYMDSFTFTYKLMKLGLSSYVKNRCLRNKCLGVYLDCHIDIFRGIKLGKYRRKWSLVTVRSYQVSRKSALKIIEEGQRDRRSFCKYGTTNLSAL